MLGHRPLALVFGIAAALAACNSSSSSSTSSGDGSGMGSSDPVTNGEAIADQLKCASCHTGKAGAYAGGGAAITGPNGLSAWAPNITPDKDTGIGGWSDDQIIGAVRKGTDDEGETLCPTMPRFADLSDGDASDLVAYLRSLVPVKNQVDDSVCPPLKGGGGAGQGGSGEGGAHAGGSGQGGSGEGGAGAGGAGQGGAGTGGSGEGGAGNAGQGGAGNAGQGGAGNAGQGGAGNAGQGGAGGAGNAGQGGAGNAGQGGAGGAPACTTDHLVISQIKSRGAAGASDEFVELYNPTNADVTLDSTWTLDAKTVGNVSYTTRWKGDGGVIPAHGHYLVVGSAYVGAVAGDGKISSVTEDASLVLNHAKVAVDAVCYASTAQNVAKLVAPDYTCEGTAVANPQGGKSTDASLERKPGGKLGNCTDTGSSADDFVPDAPSDPRDSKSAPTP